MKFVNILFKNTTWLSNIYRGHDNWYTRGASFLVLSMLMPTPDMDRTVSRRSEPSSHTALMSERPNPWNTTASYTLKTCFKNTIFLF